MRHCLGIVVTEGFMITVDTVPSVYRNQSSSDNYGFTKRRLSFILLNEKLFFTIY